MTTYPVCDIYPTIQGEGSMAGTPMVLIRLQGCAVGCPFCDTKFTWDRAEAARRGTIAEVLGDNPLWCEASAYRIAAVARAMMPEGDWALVTGGEPADHDLKDLVRALGDEQFETALETSGTATGHAGAAFDHVTVSPKVGMPGHKQVLLAAVAYADEIKWPVGKPSDVEALEKFLDEFEVPGATRVYLQPLSQSEKATRLCVETAMATGWRVSIQAHKYLGLR